MKLSPRMHTYACMCVCVCIGLLTRNEKEEEEVEENQHQQHRPPPKEVKNHLILRTLGICVCVCACKFCQRVIFFWFFSAVFFSLLVFGRYASPFFPSTWCLLSLDWTVCLLSMSHSRFIINEFVFAEKRIWFQSSFLLGTCKQALVCVCVFTCLLLLLLCFFYHHLHSCWRCRLLNSWSYSWILCVTFCMCVCVHLAMSIIPNLSLICCVDFCHLIVEVWRWQNMTER